MKITTSIEAGNKQIPHEYPKLMTHERYELVVMFTERGIGTVFHTERTSYCQGEYRPDWIMDSFVDFYGKINIVSE